MERCPCCNARLGGAAHCPRCRTDLSKILAAEQLAQYWLAQAIQLWRENQIEQSLKAIESSLQLKTTSLALALRELLIDRQCRDILELLMQKRVLAAKRKLYEIRHLFHDNERLFQLNAFTDYLWVVD